MICDKHKIVDLRSDTVTLPTQAMIQRASSAPLGDDVMGEDPTILELEGMMADKFGKERGLYVPTGTMANLVALLSHCDKSRASEIIIGAGSHINLWEGGNASSVGGIHTRQVAEDAETAELSEDDVLDCLRNGVDDHWPVTKLLCLENSHNMCGGVALPKEYFDRMGKLAHSEKMNHIDLGYSTRPWLWTRTSETSVSTSTAYPFASPRDWVLPWGVCSLARQNSSNWQSVPGSVVVVA